MSPASDPRANPKLVEALKALGLDQHMSMDLPIGTIESLTPAMRAFEEGTMAMYENLANDLPTDAYEPDVDVTTESIKGVDGNDFSLHIYKPALATGPLPCVVYFHGGGPTIISTSNKVHNRCEQIAGIYATVPYISNGYAWPEDRKRKELSSILENDGYWIPMAAMATTGYYYGPNDTKNPHAWPYYSRIEDLEGLPPVRLAMDELDPLRDEGIAFYRKLIAAGVEATAHVNLGMVHASSMIFRKALPEVHNAAIADIAAFAKGL